MKFDFHLKSGRKLTLDFPDVETLRGLQSHGDRWIGSDGIVFVEDVEAVTVHAGQKPASSRTLIDGDGDTWTEGAPDQWLCVTFDPCSYTLAEIKEDFGPLRKEPR